MLADRYRLIAPIGRGASATVYLAEDKSLRRQVAVKVLHEGLRDDPTFLARFRKEAQAAASLSHPNIMSVHDWGDDEPPFLVMEYLGGGSLRALLDESKRLTPSQAIAVGLEACRGLHFAHDRGLVHRDIKPANLLFGHEGRLRIGDFGLARALADAPLTDPGDGIVGTVRYASPEQAAGRSSPPCPTCIHSGSCSSSHSPGRCRSRPIPPWAHSWPGSRTTCRFPICPRSWPAALTAMTQRDPANRSTATKAGVALLQAAEGLPRPQPLELVGAVAESIELGDDDQTLLGADVGELPIDATEIGGTPAVDRSVDDGPTRRWPLLLLTMIAIGVASWFIWTELESALPAEVEIPNVVGMDQASALTELGTTWELVEKRERVADIDIGSVSRTNPAAGETLTEGEVLEYWVSLGRPLVLVPKSSLIGRSREQAIITIEAANLTVGTITEELNEDVGAGLVVDVSSDSPEVPEGAPVDLVVSLGPRPRPIPAPEPGQLATEYIMLLDELGLGATPSDDWDPEVPEGEVVSLSVEPGELVPRGTVIDVVISRGPEPRPVPETSGLGLTPAIEALEAEGFLAGEIGGSGEAGCPVVGTDPPEGTLLQPGNPVNILMSEC